MLSTHSFGPDSLTNAASWLENSLLGTVATTIAVIAVAIVGLLMLNGRIEWRRGLTVVLGCFVLFGAPAIAAGLLSLGGGIESEDAVPPAISPSPPPVVAKQPDPTYDPYAGASVIRQAPPPTAAPPR